ncbi:MAG: hypothetical protein IM610_07605 [Cytophagales bacterium]|nr:hypothetical protein [Cytophagales bacterium]
MLLITWEIMFIGGRFARPKVGPLTPQQQERREALRAQQRQARQLQEERIRRAQEQAAEEQRLEEERRIAEQRRLGQRNRNVGGRGGMRPAQLRRLLINNGTIKRNGTPRNIQSVEDKEEQEEGDIMTGRYILKTPSTGGRSPRMRSVIRQLNMEEDDIINTGIEPIASKLLGSPSKMILQNLGRHEDSEQDGRPLIPATLPQSLKFNGSGSVIAWIRNYERCGSSYNWTNLVKLRMLRGCLEGMAEAYWEQVSRSCDSWAEARDMLLKKFTSVAKQEQFRKVLLAVKQKTGESVIEYHSRFYNAYRDYGLIEEDVKLVDMFIQGLRKEFFHHMIHYKHLPFNEVLEKTLTVELDLKISDEIQGSIHAVVKETRECFYCHKKGHLARYCRKKNKDDEEAKNAKDGKQEDTVMPPPKNVPVNRPPTPRPNS